VLDAQLKARVIDEGLTPYLADSQDAWDLLPDGSYVRAKPKGRAGALSAQAELLRRMADKTATGF
jgi:polyphosphate kinase